jgi:hypothetical protein
MQVSTVVYYKTVLIVGTHKDDKFVINHVAKNKIEVSFIVLKNEGDELVYTKLFTDSKTKNIWVYGLDDDDEFEVKGNKKIKIRLIGGQNHDIYTVTNGRKTKIIDFKSKIIVMLLIQKLKNY